MYYKDLEVWKESIKLVKEIYIITKDFPKDELYGLTNQIRRCVVSIPSNIAEGTIRTSNKESARFIDIALGSLAELETQLIISQELEYIKDDVVFSKIKKVNALLIGLKKYLKQNDS